MLEAASGADQSKKCLTYGFFRDDAWAWTPGSILYVSATAGELTNVVPVGSGDQVQVFAIAVTAHIILVNPSYVLVEVA